jgi:hypothetical protein
MKILSKIKAILYVIAMILVPLGIINTIFYLICSFVALDFNPTNWLLFEYWWGRILFVFFEIFVLASVPKFWEDFDL